MPASVSLTPARPRGFLKKPPSMSYSIRPTSEVRPGFALRCRAGVGALAALFFSRSWTTAVISAGVPSILTCIPWGLVIWAFGIFRYSLVLLREYLNIAGLVKKRKIIRISMLQECATLYVAASYRSPQYLVSPMSGLQGFWRGLIRSRRCAARVLGAVPRCSCKVRNGRLKAGLVAKPPAPCERCRRSQRSDHNVGAREIVALKEKRLAGSLRERI